MALFYPISGAAQMQSCFAFTFRPENGRLPRMTTILGIETSCDETAAAIVNSDRQILANRIFSQTKEHEAYGGVVPEIAARAHAHHLDGLIRAALGDAKMELSDLDGIAVTSGPGLIGGVIVGVMTAKAIAAVTGKPFIGVNHLEGHALTARLTNDLAFPYLLLLISGGHCQLLAVEGLGKYQKLGGTLDDAMGEAFDKTAKMLSLGFPGGPAVEKMAANGNPKRFAFSQPLKGRADSQFSFSGLKTAVRNEVVALAGAGDVSDQDKADICASFQFVVGEILRERLAWGIKTYLAQHPNARTLVVAGGVAANQYLRTVLNEIATSHNMQLVVPPPKLCTDNGAMIAWAGLEYLQAGITSPLTIEPRARWPLTADIKGSAES